MSRLPAPGGAAGAALAALALLAALAPARAQSEATRGWAVFQNRCASCHSLNAAEAATLPGAPLIGLIGRRAGTAAGFDYSPALAEAGRDGLVWTRETLVRFLDDPERAVPGTFMSLRPFRDSADLVALLDYLLARAGGRR